MKVKTKVRDQVWDESEYKVWDQARNNFFLKLREQVRHKVEYKIWDEVWYQIFQNIEEGIFK
jgi:hypothetical protein